MPFDQVEDWLVHRGDQTQLPGYGLTIVSRLSLFHRAAWTLMQEFGFQFARLFAVPRDEILQPAPAAEVMPAA